MKSSTWFNRMEGFHSLEACAVHSAFFVDGILHCLVEVVVHSLWKIPILVCQHALHGCWLKALIEFQAVLREWRQLERIDDVIVAKQRNSAECFYYGARYDCYKVVVFFFVSLLLARTCIACCLGNSFGLTRLILRSSSPWTHQNQQFPNRQHRFRWSCHPNRHSLAYRPERPRSLSACWW